MVDIYNLLAGKGRGEDEYIRNVFGTPSHVNEVERDAIDTYGLGGEMFAKNVGTGDINPNTGLPEYDWKETIIGQTKSTEKSPHNRRHKDFRVSGGQKGKRDPDHKSPQELKIEEQNKAVVAGGQVLLDDPSQTFTTGLGQYNNQVPPKFQAPEGWTGTLEEAFKANLAGRLSKAPQFKGADPTEVGFLEEGKELAERGIESKWDATKYGLQAQAGKIGTMGRSGYTGSGAGIRGSIGAQNVLAQGFGAGLEARDIGMESADLTLESGVYGLGQAAERGWESDYQTFLDTLPSWG